MFKHPVPPLIYAVLFFALSGPLAVLADELNALPVPLVSAADYQIGAEGLLDDDPRNQRRAMAAADSPRITRQLASLYGGESGDRIPERGYLTDVVWSETVTYPTQSEQALPRVQERIVYYSFNIGRWKRRLNSETSVLLRAFISQPLLAFLADDDKVEIAERLAASPLFKQAVALHKAQVQQADGRAELLTDLIKALGENGVEHITEKQRQTSGQALRTAVARQAVQAPLAATTPTDLTLADGSAVHSVFDGLTVTGAANEQLDFNSYSALYYGVQPLWAFKKTDGGFWDNVNRHFNAVPLIEPVSGWLDKDVIKDFVETSGQDTAFSNSKPTKLDLAAISPDLNTVRKPVNVALFRNNPYVLFDAPQTMNIMTGLAVITKVVGQSLAVFKPKLATDLMENLKKQLKKTEAFRAWFALSYSVVNTGQQLICALAEQKDGICGDALQKLEKLAAMIPDAITSADKILKAEAKRQNKQAFTQNTGNFCGAGLALDLAASLFAPVEELGDGGKKFRFLLCTFDKVLTQPLLAVVETVLPDDYEKLTDKYSYNSVRLTADLFSRKFDTAFVEPVKPEFRLERLASKVLVKKPIALKGVLSTSLVGMKTVTDVTEFLHDVRDNKVKMQPLMQHLGDALQNYLAKQSLNLLKNLTYDLLMSMTPGKYIQLVYTVGNDGSKLLWDWMTDPSVVTVSMTRTADNTLKIGDTVPNMKGIRYLKLPDNGRDELSHSDGLNNLGGRNGEKWLAVSNAPETNQLLVYANFQASVENQSAYAIEDDYRVNQLLDNSKIRLRWHVKRFASSEEVAVIPYNQRNAGNAFNGAKNDIDVPVEKGWLWWKPIISLENSPNPLHRPEVLGDAQTKFNALDFTAVYRHQLGDKKPYPLAHKTPGIYSDYTHIEVKSPDSEVAGTLYQNTFNIYVLPNFNAIHYQGAAHNLDQSLNHSARIYCEDDPCAKNAEVQLTFVGNAWPQVGKNGLWAAWMSADGRLLENAPLPLGPVYGQSGMAIMRLPESVNRAGDYLVIYDDVMNGYIKQAGKAAANVLAKAFAQRTAQNPRYPVIVLKLSALTATDTPLLKAADRDGDNVPDATDAFPDDPNYAYDTDGDAMPDEWESRYGLNPFADDSQGDLDGDGVSNLGEFKAKTDPGHLALTLAPGDKQVTLTWRQPSDTQTQAICWSAKNIIEPANCLAEGNAPTNWLENQTSPVVIKKLSNGKLYYFAVVAENLGTGKTIESKVLTATPQKIYTLNDTGIKTCSDNSQNGLPCPVEGYPGQDAESGRDVTQNDPSNGHAGFNFVKISATGAALPASSTSWSCVKDNVTGLTWEVKTDDGGLHDWDWRYTWYEPDPAKNGGFVGYQNGGSCGGTSECDTHGFVEAVNRAGWCGHKDWRMPTVEELEGIVSFDRYNPAIDAQYFPRTSSNNWHWSGSPYAYYSGGAWFVSFLNGYSDGGNRDGRYGYGAVRLVRGGQ